MVPIVPSNAPWCEGVGGGKGTSSGRVGVVKEVRGEEERGTVTVAFHTTVSQLVVAKQQSVVAKQQPVKHMSSEHVSVPLSTSGMVATCCRHTSFVCSSSKEFPLPRCVLDEEEEEEGSEVKTPKQSEEVLCRLGTRGVLSPMLCWMCSASSMSTPRSNSKSSWALVGGCGCARAVAGMALSRMS